jgi:hypothetical protein
MHTISLGQLVKLSNMLKHGFELVYVKISKQVPKHQIVCKLITFWVHLKSTFKIHVHVPFPGMYGKNSCTFVEKLLE